VPLAFAVVAAAVVLSVVIADPGSAARGALLLALGVPVFYWFRSRTGSQGLQPTRDDPDS
jgi:hypothetical protein